MDGFSSILSKKTYSTAAIIERASISVIGNRGKQKTLVSVSISSSLADALNWKRETTLGLRISDDKTRLAICPTNTNEGWKLTAYGNSEALRISFKAFEELGFFVSLGGKEEVPHEKDGNILILNN